MTKDFTDSTLDDFSRWLDQSKLLAKFITREGEDGGGFLQCCHDLLDSYHVNICRACERCFNDPRSDWSADIRLCNNCDNVQE